MKLQSLFLAGSLALSSPAHGNIDIGNGDAISHERVCKVHSDIRDEIHYITQVCEGTEPMYGEGNFNDEMCENKNGNRVCVMPEQIMHHY